MVEKPSEGNREIWLAAGGTGGHIYPALALGRALLEQSPEYKLTYFCGSRPGELKIYKSSGIEPVVLPIAGRGRGVAGISKFLANLISAYRTVGRGNRPAPIIAIGFGGYPSVPVLLQARRRGAITAIHEQNAWPGFANRFLANRFLARSASKIFLGAEVREGFFPATRTQLVGNPVRASIFERRDSVDARRELGLPEGGRICLCFGGSLGARGINRMVQNLLTDENLGDDWHFLWAAGPDLYEPVKAWLESRASAFARRVTLRPYLDQMDLAYAAADVAICRAGALTLAELAAVGLPSALVPLPSAANDHQRSNARRMEEAGASIVVEEADEEGPQKIQRWLKQIEEDSGKLASLSEAARKLVHPNAAQDMAIEIQKLVDGPN